MSLANLPSPDFNPTGNEDEIPASIVALEFPMVNNPLASTKSHRDSRDLAHSISVALGRLLLWNLWSCFGRYNSINSSGFVNTSQHISQILHLCKKWSINMPVISISKQTRKWGYNKVKQSNGWDKWNKCKARLVLLNRVKPQEEWEAVQLLFPVVHFY